MPHQCIHCSATYADGAPEILSGCSACKGRFFFYLTAEKLLKIQQARVSATPIMDAPADEKEQIEQDVREIVGITDMDAPVILDFESVQVTASGKYILDIPNLFSKQRPLVYKLEDGKYIIDLSSVAKVGEKLLK
jgi:predicted  nucleic acid-binding Zn-ribbon protein